VFDKPLFENRQVMNIYGGLKEIQDNDEFDDGDKPDVEKV